MILLPGDVVFARNPNLLGKLIRFFSTSRGQPTAVVNHVGVIVEGSSIETNSIVVEALSRVQKHSLGSQYGGTKQEIAVFRPLNLTEEEIAIIVAKANLYVGDEYGYGKILAHIGDWLLCGAYFFRRFASMDKYPICSWLVAESFAAAGKNFGVLPGAAEPDDMWVFCISNPDKYKQIRWLKIL